jgi:biotin carboxyl carrier protein
MRFIVTIGSREVELEAIPNNPCVTVRLGNQELPAMLESEPGSKICTLTIREHAFKIAMMRQGPEYVIQWRGYDFPVKVERTVIRYYRSLLQKAAPQLQEASAIYTMASHMPGLIGKLFAREGQRIEVGERLWVLEAMKMENEITSPVSGVIEKLHVQTGTQVEKGQLLCIIRVSDRG